MFVLPFYNKRMYVCMYVCMIQWNYTSDENCATSHRHHASLQRRHKIITKK